VSGAITAKNADCTSEEKMDRSQNSKGLPHFYTILAGIVMLILIGIFLGYYNSHRSDINVHTPPSETR
jgi:hypothetical protein